MAFFLPFRRMPNRLITFRRIRNLIFLKLRLILLRKVLFGLSAILKTVVAEEALFFKRVICVSC
jgi:hypothetical protein